MRFFTQIAILGSAFTLAAAVTNSTGNGTANSAPFRLGAVDLTTNKVTPVVVGQTEASIHILQAGLDASGQVPPSLRNSSNSFKYLPSTKQLWSEEYGVVADTVYPRFVVTVGEFLDTGDGALVQKTGDDGSAYLVYSGDVDGRTDGWSLCGTHGIYWSGEEDALANCTKVALEMQ
ncbi:hypothetical protein F5Y19DRAFT_413265 [Xylariaceae sp. FL1651]|nr:hypothetical protein F5Y19DRAFT_413265 [Xylariaceae sp. FL1651]